MSKIDLEQVKKDLFSSKSLRISSITKFLTHQGVDFFKSHARSVQILGTNKESYLEWNILTLTLPGVYALNWWVDATPNKSYPGLYYLGPHGTEQSNFLIKELYIVSVPQLNPYGSLYPVLF